VIANAFFFLFTKTTTNISDGLSALCVSCEMVLIAALQMWAFYWGEYHIDRLSKPMGKANKKGKTNVFMAILHALNFSDFMVELWHELRFLWDRIRGKEYTRADARYGKFDFVSAFNANEDEDYGGGRKAAAPLELIRSNTIEMTQAHSGGDHHEKMSGSKDDELQSKQALLAAGTPPAQSSYHHQGLAPALQGQPTYYQNESPYQQQDPPFAPAAALHVPTTASNGRISPKPRSPRDSTGRYPSFLYEGSGSPQNLYQQGSFPSNQNMQAHQARQPSPVDQSSWATPGAYTVRGFPRNSVAYSNNGGGDQNPYATSTSHGQQEESSGQHQPESQHQHQDAGKMGVPTQIREERPRSWEPQAL